MSEANEIVNRTGPDMEGARAPETPPAVAEPSGFYCIIEGCARTWAPGGTGEPQPGYETFEELAAHAEADHGMKAIYATTAATAADDEEEIVYVIHVEDAAAPDAESALNVDAIVLPRVDLPMTIEEAANLGILDIASKDGKAAAKAVQESAPQEGRCDRCGQQRKIRAFEVQRVYDGSPVGSPTPGNYCESCRASINKDARMKVTRA